MAFSPRDLWRDYTNEWQRSVFEYNQMRCRMQKARSTMQRDFYVVIERDEDGFYVGEVPQLRACYTQGRTLDELMTNIREVIELCLEDQREEPLDEFLKLL
jgi:predicted RNase H-like HicB family nuclease